jgi:16S rRNA processing protein RimM
VAEVAVGRLIRTRGIRGELVAEIYSLRPGRADELKGVMLDLNGRRREAVVERVWVHDGRTVFKFAGIDSIDQAEEWAGADLLVPEAERVRAEEGEFFHADLIGCAVIGKDAMQPIGVVTAVEEFGGPPLLKVAAPDGRQILIPFALSICREIDVAAKKIRVELPEGLLELP